VEALDANGKWIQVIDDMGFQPACHHDRRSQRTPSPETQRIRISTNLQIYWDDILIDRTIKT
jgi:hypothetical protein